MKYYRGNMLRYVDAKYPETFMTNPYPPGFSKVEVPEGRSGEWEVSKFSVDVGSVGLFNLRLIRDGRPDRVIPEGTYTKLLRRWDVVMSDTPAEAHEHNAALGMVGGDVLLNGLGLGFFLKAVLSKDSVQSVTVIEKSPDVIKLVGPSYQDERVNIIEADAFTWKPPRGKKYDFVWHDIWDEIDPDNRGQMKALRQKYGHRTRSQACWSARYL